MQTRLLLRISLITSLIGLILLFFLSENLEPRLFLIEDLNEGFLDEYVRVSGIVTGIKETTGLYILTVKDSTGEIEVVLFKGKEKLSFQKDSFIEVTGIVSEYKKRLQIEALKIKQKEFEEQDVA